MIPVVIKELNAFFSSFAAYVIIGFFIILVGLLMWVFPETNILDGGYAEMRTLFSYGPYIFMLLVPAITMHSFAEEKKTGTLELLLTTQLSTVSLILGKYFASMLIILLIILLTMVYYLSIWHLGDPVGNIDSAGVFGSYIGLVLLVAVFCAIGLLASSITEKQIVSFLVGVLFCFILYHAFDAWAILQTWSKYSLNISQIGIRYHYCALSKGVVDSRDLVYFIFVIVVLLHLTNKVINMR